MSKSDDKPWVKKPDIIMEQLEDRIVFAADVANAEPVAAVTVQAQAQAEAPSGGEAPGSIWWRASPIRRAGRCSLRNLRCYRRQRRGARES